MDGRVVVLGSLSQDLHLDMPRHPHTGETVMSGDITRRFGGKGANQAVAAAGAGVTTLIIGKVGDDQPGLAYRDRLDRYGVDTSRLLVASGAPTGTAIIYVNDEHDNMIVVAPGANHRIDLAEVAALDDLTSADIVLMPNELQPHIVVAATARAVERGARVLLNLAPYDTLPYDTLAACELVIVNEHEYALMVDDGIELKNVLITRGTDGSTWGGIDVPAVRVEAVDTTGAGDAYCGTLAARLVLGAAPGQAMTAAAAAAAVCVQHLGAQPPLSHDDAPQHSRA
ncbi:MAG: ribokinase [Propionibacteriales bacterium]|nr:ribokinase [Propionibacteriales bacterium]